MDYHYYQLFITLAWVLALIVWAFSLVRYLMNKTNKRTEVVTAFIEKNPDANIDELLKKMAPTKRLLKEKLLTKLLVGCIFLFLGIGVLTLDIYWTIVRHDVKNPFTLFSPVLLAIGIAFIINYFVGKKMLAKEIEAEETDFRGLVRESGGFHNPGRAGAGSCQRLLARPLLRQQGRG